MHILDFLKREFYMDDVIEGFITDIERRLPRQALLSGRDLVNTGIVKSESTLFKWRERGYGPPFIRISSGQIRYIRTGIIDWLRKCSTK